MDEQQVVTGRPVTVTLPTDTSVLVTREFAAAPHPLYRACTDPHLVRRWWGGGTGEVTVAELDLRVGGRWRFVVTGDGYEVASHGVYHLIVPGARIVCTEAYEDQPDALCTYTFRSAGGRTTVGLLTALRTREDRDAMLDSGMEQGVAASWDLLERVALAVTPSGWPGPRREDPSAAPGAPNGWHA